MPWPAELITSVYPANSGPDTLRPEDKNKCRLISGTTNARRACPMISTWGAYASVVEVFERSCKKFADRPAFSNMGVTLTYAELGSPVGRLCRLPAAPYRSQAWRAHRRADAQYPAIPDRRVRRIARRPYRGQHQPAVHRAGNEAPVQGCRRSCAGLRQPVWPPGAGGTAGYQHRLLDRGAHGGHAAKPQGLAGQYRGEKGQEDGAGPITCRRLCRSKACWPRAGGALSNRCR